jgi:hypothetical protein
MVYYVVPLLCVRGVCDLSVYPNLKAAVYACSFKKIILIANSWNTINVTQQTRVGVCRNSFTQNVMSGI